jgi:hypothetical protein
MLAWFVMKASGRDAPSLAGLSDVVFDVPDKNSTFAGGASRPGSGPYMSRRSCRWPGKHIQPDVGLVLDDFVQKEMQGGQSDGLAWFFSGLGTGSDVDVEGEG